MFRITFLWLISLLVLIPCLSLSQIHIVAVGGASFYKPRNTVVAVRLAWEYNADGVMLDIFQSKDAEWFAFSPQDISQYSDREYELQGLKSKRIKKISLHNSLSRSSLKYQISTLDDVISLLPEDKFFILKLDEKENELKSLFNTLKNHRNYCAVRYISSNWSLLKKLKDLVPKDKIYYMWNGFSSLGITIDNLKEFGISSIVLKSTQLNKQGLQWLNESGIKVHVMLDSEEDGQGLVHEFPSVVALFTTRPQWVRTSISSISNEDAVLMAWDTMRLP
ncbi:hypothetical protein K4L44_13540 [Halosquirtibacter laminarini]|uniref:Uncharacterized protein n=1 Tax=Halosquirtibacter laminarini TaxID=3374600 RepID=A0AC61NDF6_9BACT|nr:hypothetical protein K4L44_13540 [Prolixibacteraceae bacterium]